jgi:hypothetical protein
MGQQPELHAFVGWDSRDSIAYRVCVASLRGRAGLPVHAHRLDAKDLQRSGLYRRPTERRDGHLWDVVSAAPMGTSYAVARFFAPLVARERGVAGPWILVCDGDLLWRADVRGLLDAADPAKAVMCVRHAQAEAGGAKLNAGPQTAYPRKNWSSMMLVNLDHPANARLTPELLNTAPGRDLHAFGWLDDDDVGGLDEDWNWLEGWSPAPPSPPRVVHYVRGGPWLPGCGSVAYADLWLAEYGRLVLAERGIGPGRPGDADRP